MCVCLKQNVRVRVMCRTKCACERMGGNVCVCVQKNVCVRVIRRRMAMRGDQDPRWNAVLAGLRRKVKREANVCFVLIRGEYKCRGGGCVCVQRIVCVCACVIHLGRKMRRGEECMCLYEQNVGVCVGEGGNVCVCTTQCVCVCECVWGGVSKDGNAGEQGPKWNALPVSLRKEVS